MKRIIETSEFSTPVAYEAVWEFESSDAAEEASRRIAGYHVAQASESGGVEGQSFGWKGGWYVIAISTTPFDESLDAVAGGVPVLLPDELSEAFIVEFWRKLGPVLFDTPPV